MTTDSTIGEANPKRTSESALAALVALGADLLDEALVGTVSLAQVVRTETFGVAGSALDWIETVSRAGLKVARETVARLDRSTRTALDGTEHAARAISNAMRGSSEAACDLIARTTAPFTGAGPSRKAA